jgi:RNA polymerase sigma factor (sigma-70 family)
VAVDVTVALPGGDPGRFLRAEPDDALSALARDGNVAAFEAIYDRHHRGLIAFCRHMLGSREEAEDALQHTFAAAYRALACAGDRPAALKPWLYTIARNRCLTVLRARRTREAVPDTPGDGTVGEGLADAVQLRADLRDLVEDLHRLPEDQRAALVLFELGDHSHAEIAEVLDVERAKVKALVFQAREGLLRARTARDTPCAEIRRHLSSRTRALPRRGVIRGHLDCCAACAAFDLEVRRQRAALAIILPVVPSLELRGSVLAPLAGGGATVAGGGAALAGGAGAGASGVSMTAAAGLGTGGAGVSAATLSTGAAGTIASAGAAASGLGAFAAKAVVAKVITAVAVAGAAGGSVHHARAVHRHAPRPAVAIVAPAQAADRPRAGRDPAVIAAPRPPIVSATPAVAASAAPAAAATATVPAASVTPATPANATPVPSGSTSSPATSGAPATATAPASTSTSTPAADAPSTGAPAPTAATPAPDASAPPADAAPIAAADAAAPTGADPAPASDPVATDPTVTATGAPACPAPVDSAPAPSDPVASAPAQPDPCPAPAPAVDSPAAAAATAAAVAPAAPAPPAA